MADCQSSNESNNSPSTQSEPFRSQHTEPGSQDDTQHIATTSTSQQSDGHRDRSPLYGPTKVFQDPIHGTIELDKVYTKIIDTPQFQRLRNIKQLGTVNFVYPGAVHTRFEHSIGTCHLALRLIRRLRERQGKEFEITDEDELCVGVAALCHDLGHGPFSHMFDKIVIPKLKPKKYKNWCHELGSIKIFNGIVKEYKLEGYGLKEDQCHLIREMIFGPLKKSGYKSAADYQAVPPKKYFLYEIVNNKTNQIDVDKWDYFARDSYHLGVTSSFMHDRFIKFAKIMKVQRKGRWETQICYRDKEVTSAYELFHTRYRLYRMACYHPVTIAMELLIADVLLKAARQLKLKTPDGKKKFKMKAMLTDMEKYRMLDDNILSLILHSRDDDDDDGDGDDDDDDDDDDDEDDGHLAFAREMLKRMQKRDIYKLVSRFQLKKSTNIEEKDIQLNEIVDREENSGKELQASHLSLKIVVMDYGLKDKNPVDRVLFYNKHDQTPRKIPKDQVSFLLPQMFEERVLYFYVKDDKKKELAAKCINAWAKDKSWFVRSHETGLLRTLTEPQPCDAGDGSQQEKKRQFSKL